MIVFWQFAEYLFVATDSEHTFPRQLSPEVLQALRGVRFIAQHIKDADKDNEVRIREYKLFAHYLDNWKSGISY